MDNQLRDIQLSKLTERAKELRCIYKVMEILRDESADLVIDNHFAGKVQVVYTQLVFESENPFLPDEQRLLNSIAENLGRFIFFRRLKKTLEMSKTYENSEQADDRSLLAYESDEHWKWRYEVSQKIADHLDLEKFGVEAIYVIGSTKDGRAGPGSLIDYHIITEEDIRRKTSYASMIGAVENSAKLLRARNK